MSTNGLTFGESLLVIFYVQFTATFIYARFDSALAVQLLASAVASNFVDWTEYTLLDSERMLRFIVVVACGMLAGTVFHTLAVNNELESNEPKLKRPTTINDGGLWDQRVSICRGFGIVFILGLYWLFTGLVIIVAPSRSANDSISYLIAGVCAVAVVVFPLHRSTLAPIPDEVYAIRQLLILTAPLVPFCYFPHAMERSEWLGTIIVSLLVAINAMVLVQPTEVTLPPGYEADQKLSTTDSDSRHKILYWLLFYAAPLTAIWSTAFFVQQRLVHIDTMLMTLILSILGVFGLSCLFLYSASRPLKISMK